MPSSSSYSNSNQKLFKFVFQAYIKTISLALKFPCVVSVIWKRGYKAQYVKYRKPIYKGIITFNETLEIYCNMTFDMNKKAFYYKKTKFTILIFSYKGNKQAGEVYLDVAELLNTKSKVLEYYKPLEKCPDKNAKLSLSLQCYMKEEITSDMVSQRSQKTYDIEASLNKDASNMKPDFKKKKNEALMIEDKGNDEKLISKSAKKLMIAPSILVSPSNKRSQTPNDPSSQIQKKATNISSTVDIYIYTKLYYYNRLLKQQLQYLRDLYFYNYNLKRKYEEADKKAESYYKKKYQEMKDEYNELKKKSQYALGLIKKKESLYLAMCECKETIGKIFNYAIMTGNGRLMETMYQLEY